MIDPSLFNNRGVLSIDTETTGLNENKGRIWSIGFTEIGKSTVEKFFGNHFTNVGDYSGFENEALSNSVFQRKQKEAGAFLPYKKAMDEGTLLDDEGIKSLLLEHITGDKIFLAQNLQFENKFLSKAAYEMGPEFYDELKSRMAYQNVGIGSENARLFYRPPQVTNASNEARDTYKNLLDEFKKRKLTTEDLAPYAEKHKNVMKAYETAFKTSEGVVAADLQDFTKALYATAAYKGILGLDAVKTHTTSIEVLSQIFNEGRELHQAGSDSKQQMNIFHKIVGLYNAIDSNQMTDEHQEYISRLKRVLPEVRKGQVYSTTLNALEELQHKGEWIDMSNTQSKLLTSWVRSKNGTEEFNVFVPNRSTIQPSQHYTRQEDILRVLKEKFQKEGEGDLSIFDELADKTPDERKELLSAHIDSEKERISKLITNPESVMTQDLPDAGEIFKRAQAQIEGAKEIKVHKLSRSMKMGLGILATTGVGLYLLSKHKRNKEKQDEDDNLTANIKARGNTPNAIFDTFDYNTRQYPVTYNGTGFYNWENRTGHHRA